MNTKSSIFTSGEATSEIPLFVFMREIKNDLALKKSNFLFVVLLFYVHGKHLRSCRDGQLT